MSQDVVSEISQTCESIVALILVGDPQGVKLLYATFAKGLTYVARKYCPELAEDCAHDAILAVSQQIQQGQLQTPAALPGYLNIIIKRTAWTKRVQADRLGAEDEVFTSVLFRRWDESNNPGRLLQLRERADILKQALSKLKPQEREMLSRFYLHGQGPAESVRQWA